MTKSPKVRELETMAQEPTKVLLIGDSAAVHSVTGDMPVAARIDGRPHVMPMKDFVDKTHLKPEIAIGGGEWRQPSHISMHKHTGQIITTCTSSGCISTTPNHSLLTQDFERITPEEAYNRRAPLNVRRLTPTTFGCDKIEEDEALFVSIIAASRLKVSALLSIKRALVPTKLITDFRADQRIARYAIVEHSHAASSSEVVLTFRLTSEGLELLNRFCICNSSHDFCLKGDVVNLDVDSMARLTYWMRMVYDPSGESFGSDRPTDVQIFLIMFVSVSELDYQIDVRPSGHIRVLLMDRPFIRNNEYPIYLTNRRFVDTMVYDLEIDDGPEDEKGRHSFLAGVGHFRVHNTGLAKALREPFVRIAKDPAFSLKQVGFFHHYASEQTPFEIVPTTGQGDIHGEKTIPQVIEGWKPDIIWTDQDPWHLMHLAALKKRGLCPLIWHTFIESGPLPQKLGELWSVADQVVPATEFGHRQLAMILPSGKIKPPILSGVDHKVFRPLSPPDRQRHRANLIYKTRQAAGKTNPFVIGFNGRNFSRKNIWCLFHLAAILSKKLWKICASCRSIVAPPRDYENMKWKPIAKCDVCGSKKLAGPQPSDPDFLFWYHIPANETRGWDMKNLLYQYELGNDIIFTNGYEIGRGLPDNQMWTFYNCLDCYVSFAPEGFGYPHLEAMACGVPVVSTSAGGGAEVVKPLGLLCDPLDFMIPPDMSVGRPLPYYSKYLSNIWKVYRSSKTDNKLQKLSTEMAAKYDWDKTAEQWRQLLLSVPKDTGVTEL